MLSDPRLSRGTAFTETERAELGLIGLLPPAVFTIEEQAGRAFANLCSVYSGQRRFAEAERYFADGSVSGVLEGAASRG